MSWKREDEVTTTAGTIWDAQDQSFTDGWNAKHRQIINILKDELARKRAENLPIIVGLESLIERLNKEH